MFVCICVYMSNIVFLIVNAGVPRVNTPPPLSSIVSAGSQERTISAPRPIRLSTNTSNKLGDLNQPWTRSPTKSGMNPVLPKWKFISGFY